MKLKLVICVLILFSEVVRGQSEKKEEVYSVVDTMPQYPGGDSALMTFIARNIDYPIAARMDGVKGKVYVGFVVNSMGKVENIRILRGIRADLDSASVDVIKKVGDWKPGILNGKNVTVSYTLPVRFEIREGSQSDLVNGESENDKSVYTVVEKMPEYPGGESALLEDIHYFLIYPVKAKIDGISGRVFVQFVINKDGNLVDEKIVRGIRADVDSAALETLRSLKQWTPGEQNGKHVNIQFTLPISFRIQSVKDSRRNQIITKSRIVFQKQIFSRNEPIAFYIGNEEGLESPTISCSCGRSDFYYQVYKVNDDNRSDSLITNHTERLDSKKCDCKYGTFYFIPDAVNSVSGIPENGVYYIRLFNKSGSYYSSETFTVQ